MYTHSARWSSPFPSSSSFPRATNDRSCSSLRCTYVKCYILDESAWVSISSNNDMAKKNVRRPVKILVLYLMNVYIFRCYESVRMCVFIHTYALTKHAGQKNKLTCLNAGGETGWRYACRNVMMLLVTEAKIGTVTGLFRGGKVYFFRTGRGYVCSRSCIAAFLSILRGLRNVLIL